MQKIADILRVIGSQIGELSLCIFILPIVVVTIASLLFVSPLLILAILLVALADKISP
jgi:hypothetical protein